LATGERQLIEVIRGEIRAAGPISFARFMELALYQPEHGYYASGRATIGRRGDFFTNISVGSLFGRLLAAQFAEIWDRLGQSVPFQVVEQGAHEGAFAADALNALHDRHPDCFEATNYVIVEPFRIWRERQREKLASFRKKVCWVESCNELNPFTGIHFSNELFDALPTHLVVTADTGEWKEKFVALAAEDFTWVTRTIDDPELRARLENLDSRAGGYETEVNLMGPRLIRDIASKIEHGIILVIDYGFARCDFYDTSRDRGTLQVRSRQRKLASPFDEVGRADISTHVEWTSLAEAAVAMAPIGFTDQHHFLTGILTELLEPAAAEKLGPAEKRGLQTLLHPEMLGRNFQVLALGRNFLGPLSGFRFGREPREQLGLGGK
jgi:SAM-dependent MidA family methyltransferase